MSDQQRTAITLNVGDRLKARPCEVIVTKAQGSVAWGYCEVCEMRHAIDRRMFESGKGPWRRAENGSTPSGGAS